MVPNDTGRNKNAPQQYRGKYWSMETRVIWSLQDSRFEHVKYEPGFVRCTINPAFYKFDCAVWSIDLDVLAVLRNEEARRELQGIESGRRLTAARLRGRSK